MFMAKLLALQALLLQHCCSIAAGIAAAALHAVR
jgi:hypothetical protein